VRNTGSAVAAAHPTVSPARISCVKSSASGAMVTGARAAHGRHLTGARHRRPRTAGSRRTAANPCSPPLHRRGELETRGTSSGHLIRTAETSASCRERICLHISNHLSAFSIEVRSSYPDMRLFLSEGSVHLSCQSSRS
jgi:hypothetical protein